MYETELGNFQEKLKNLRINYRRPSKKAKWLNGHKFLDAYWISFCEYIYVCKYKINIAKRNSWRIFLNKQIA